MIRRLVHYVTLAALVLVIAGWALFLRPQSLGGPAAYVVIRGSSMVPAFETGDLVIVRAASSYAVGDVVAYEVPDGEIGAGHIVIHRIVGGDGSNGFTLQGDNNNTPDPWMPRATDIVGRAWLSVSALGRVIAYVHQPVIVAAIAAALIMTLILARQPARAKAA